MNARLILEVFTWANIFVVRSLLAAIYEIDPARLQALGRGKSELKDKSRPEDGINRRVEIRNVTN